MRWRAVVRCHAGLVLALITVGLTLITLGRDGRWDAQIGAALYVLSLLGLPWTWPVFGDGSAFRDVPPATVVLAVVFGLVNLGVHAAVAAVLDRQPAPPGDGGAGGEGAGVREPRSPAPSSPARARASSRREPSQRRAR